MDFNNLKENEYFAQLYGFTVEDFMLGFKDLIQEEVTRFTNSMALTLVKKYPDGDPEIELVNDTTKALAAKYMVNAEEPLRVLKAQLQELMRIPSHVLLPSDKAQATQYTAEDEQEVDNQLDDLFHRLKRAKAVKVELHQELKMLQNVLPVLNKRVQELEKEVINQKESEKVLEHLEPLIDKPVCKTKDLMSLLDDSL